MLEISENLLLYSDPLLYHVLLWHQDRATKYCLGGWSTEYKWQWQPQNTYLETVFSCNDLVQNLLTASDVNKANSVKAKAKARQYKAKARGLQGQDQGLTLQRIKSRS